MNYWEEERGTASVLHILVVGFHHQKGCSLEYAYPPFSSNFDSSPCSSLTSQLPQEWRHLPYLALPDGCHHYEEEVSFFVLPPRGCCTSSGAVYGVSCCRQIDADEVEPSDEITRSTVVKSVCILSKYPYYGNIEEKLRGLTKAYFNHKDFSKISILQEALTSINSSLLVSKSPTPLLSVGLTIQQVVMKFGCRLLQIYKALLLQKRVLVCGLPTKEVCKSVLSILALFPLAAEDVVKPGHLKKNDCGFPLDVFPTNLSVQPYMCLQQMECLTSGDTYSLVGVANPLFQKNFSKYCDVFMDMSEPAVYICEPKLKAALYLTAADLRFCDYLSTSVTNVTSSTVEFAASSWFGSNEWIRSQFKLYLLSLLATSLSANNKNLLEFGKDFVDCWQTGSVYTNWKLSSKNYTGMAKVDPVHLCTGDLTFSDIKLRLSAQATEYGLSDRSKERVGAMLKQTHEAVGGAVGNVRTAVGGVWNAASSAVSAWWWSGKEDDI